MDNDLSTNIGFDKLIQDLNYRCRKNEILNLFKIKQYLNGFLIFSISLQVQKSIHKHVHIYAASIG